MHFGEYLVEAGAVCESDVLTALAGQQRRQPFAPQLAVELGLISAQEAFRILNLADHRGRDFLEVAHEEGALEERDLVRLAQAEREAVPQLGTLLLAMDLLEPRTLHTHLSEFRRKYPERITAARRISQSVLQRVESSH